MNSKKAIGSIVVRGTNWIGDAIISIPALRQLSRIFPDAEIVLHTRKWAEGIFQDADFLDRIVAFEPGKWKPGDVFTQADALRPEKFDLAILFPNSFESAAAARIASIPRRIGYNKDLRGLLLTDPVPVPEWKSRRHEAFYFLNLIAETERRFLGTATVMQSEPDSRLDVSEDRKNGARQMLHEEGLDLSKKLVVLGAGSANSRAKRWGTAKFAELNGRLQHELNASIVLVGSADETEIAAEVQGLSPVPAIDLTGKTTLGEIAAVLSIADLLVSNDMGLAHVAPAVGTKTAVIFGPTDPVTTRPFSENAIVIRHPVECSPCMLRDCPIDHRCMTRVTVDEVFGVCVNLLADEEPAVLDEL